MKITKRQLRKIIKEEKAKVLAEQDAPDDRLFDDEVWVRINLNFRIFNSENKEYGYNP